MNLKPIKAKNVTDGDILYIPSEYMVNHCQELLGLDYSTTDSDIIVIVDDIGGDSEWLINGGHVFYIEDDNQVFYKIGHYSELISELNNK